MKVTREQLENALNDAWGEWVGDTHCVPRCIEIHGPRTTRVSLDFTKEPNFTDSVLWRLNREIEHESEGK